eukprot:gene978-1495_t
MTGLTPSLLKLFAARDPAPFVPPPTKKKLPSYSGIGQYVSEFANPGDPEHSPPVTRAETKEEKKTRIAMILQENGEEAVKKGLEEWDPTKNEAATGDAYKTLFVARINYDTSESKLKREFEEFGPVKRINLVHDKNSGKPRGYAFIEYSSSREMKNAYKMGDGRKIDGRRVLVDVERGRTVPNWRPRRLAVIVTNVLTIEVTVAVTTVTAVAATTETVAVTTGIVAVTIAVTVIRSATVAIAATVTGIAATVTGTAATVTGTAVTVTGTAATAATVT